MSGHCENFGKLSDSGTYMIRDIVAFAQGGNKREGAGYLCVDCSICIGYTSLHIGAILDFLFYQRKLTMILPFRSNLAPVILQLKALGIDNVLRFNFLTPPPVEMMIRSLEVSWARETIYYNSIVLLISSNHL